ncbi:MAG TPA: N-acetylmuramoyl-L-alanine amidase, partial [Ignavibacteriaceae bacterium]|nr:N-acetylmuramoyl-L-alanine amidase [Ignavibacteriaceae bacterium]
MKIKLLLFFLLLTLNTYAQQTEKVAVVTSAGTKYINAFERQGIIYFSAIQFAEALSINYYYNADAQKVELKFNNYTLKITSKNPYLVLIGKGSSPSEEYQLPTSTYFIDEQIFIPLEYSFHIIKKAYGKNLSLEEGKIVLKGKFIPEETKTTTEFDITGISIDEKINGTLVRIKSKTRILTYTSSYNANVLKIIFRNINADIEKLKLSNGQGLIKNISAKNVGKETEIEFTLGNEYTTNEVLNADGSNDILITIHNKIFSGSQDREKNKSKWNFDVIVIDAGHGGKDVGAVGVNGIKEKDINLGVSLKLGKLIEQNMKDVKIVYTRKNDTFVELYKRGKIANEQGGKLFISIHCNSTPKKPSNATGFEVYLLRPGRTTEAISIAERENSVIQYEENPEKYEKL